MKTGCIIALSLLKSLMEGQLERRIFSLPWSLKLGIILKRKTLLFYKLKCQQHCVFDISIQKISYFWLQCYEMISCATLKMTAVCYMWAPWETASERVPSLESCKYEGLFQLHNEKVSNSCCSQAFLVQLSPHGRSQSTHQGPLAEMVCFGT